MLVNYGMELDAKETSRGKILFVLSLYIVLAIIAFFNFGIYRHLFCYKTNSKTAVHITNQMNTNEEAEDTSIEEVEDTSITIE